MTTMTKEERLLMKNKQTRLVLVKEYMLAQENHEDMSNHLKDAFGKVLKTKKGRKDWHKYCHQDWLDAMPAAERAEWDEHEALADARVAARKPELDARFWRMMAIMSVLFLLLMFSITMIMISIYP